MMLSASCVISSLPAEGVAGKSTPGERGINGHGGASLSATVRGTVLLPSAPLTLTPLYCKRLCDVPLTLSLVSPSPSAGSGATNGFLTMDQARSLLPMTADDPNVGIFMIIESRISL